MSLEKQDQFVNIKMLDFIQINPTPILHLFHERNQNRLYVSREKYSEIYQIREDKESKVTMQSIAELEPSLYFINVGNIMALFKPFQLKMFRNGRWEYHSFTTQLLSIRICNHTVYSFHQKQTIAWHFQEDSFSMKHLTQGNSPYHIDSQGSIVGLGKKVKQISKGTKFTKLQVVENKFVFVGDDKGALHVYDWKFLSHIKTFHEHQAAILAIKVSLQSNTVYFSGSDSKVCLIRLIGDEWKLGQKNRGQSHDVFALQFFDKYLISGGVTTDFCFYLLQNNQFQGSFFHKVSYCGVNRISSEGSFVVVNNRDYFEIWQIGSNIYRTNLLVKYQMPKDKFIIDCKLFKQQIEENTFLLLVVTDEDTIGWKFNQEKGLVKFITIQNQYEMVELLPKHSFLGVRNDGLVQKISCETGKILEIANCGVDNPTDIQYIGNGLVLIGSKVSKSINILNMKTKEIVKQVSFNNTYTYIDHVDHQQLIIQYFNSPILFSYDAVEDKEKQIAKLPINLVRFGGWLNSVTKIGDKLMKSKIKKYWYGVSEGKIVVIPNILKEGKKKIRVKQTDRIAQVIRPSSRSLGCNLAIIPYNFSRMIDQLPIKPIFTKKIV